VPRARTGRADSLAKPSSAQASKKTGTGQLAANTDTVSYPRPGDGAARTGAHGGAAGPDAFADGGAADPEPVLRTAGADTFSEWRPAGADTFSEWRPAGADAVSDGGAVAADAFPHGGAAGPALITCATSSPQASPLSGQEVGARSGDSGRNMPGMPG
jgi:hypothetical protein